MTWDPDHLAHLAAKDNPACPDYTAHSENAYDRLFPGRDPEEAPLTRDESDAMDAEAEVEYQACEGH